MELPLSSYGPVFIRTPRKSAMKNQKSKPDNILTRLDKTVSKTDPARVDKLFVLILVAVCSGVVLLAKILAGK